MDFFATLLNVGVSRANDDQKIRLIRVSNLIYFTIGTCSILVSLTSLSMAYVSLIYLTIALMSYLCIGLNFFALHTPGRILFTVYLNLAILLSSTLYDSNIGHAGDRLFFLVNIGLTGVLFNFNEIKYTVPIYILLILLLVGFDPCTAYLCDILGVKLYPPLPLITQVTKFLLAGIALMLCFGYMQFIYSESQKNTLNLYTEVRRNNQELRKTLTELEATQSQLVQSNSELKQFASIVSHDLKAPLRAMGTLVDFIETDHAQKLNPDGQKQWGLLKKRISLMHNLLDGILHYTKVGRGVDRKEEIHTHQLVMEVLDMLSPPENMEISFDNELPPIHGDSTRIQQLFQNLLGNSIKFIDKPKGKILITSEEQENHWKFSIKDNGPGIDEKHYERIFKIFETLQSRDNSDNTGVGLSIVKKIVEMHEGKVWLDSKLGVGTTFHFTIKKSA